MIVNCEKCGSKFKVDDAKIPDAGIMARCSICSHRFHLKKEPEIVDLCTEYIIGPEDETGTAEPVPEQKKTSERLDPSLFAEPAAPQKEFAVYGGAPLEKREEASPIPVAAPPIPSASTQPSPAATWDFSNFFADDENGETVTDDSMNVVTAPGFEIVVETSGQHDICEVSDEVQEIDEEDDVFRSDPVDIETNPAYKAFTKFMELQSTSEVLGEDQGFAELVGAQEPSAIDAQAPAAVVGKLASSAAEEKISTDSEHIQSNPTVETHADTSARHPAHEIVADDRRGSKQSGLQQSGREIITLLEESGLTGEYVLRKVQEVCEATRYVEGVEKPDWPTRVLGLDILCKIKGLYPPEKKDDHGNRQLQIVTGINM